MDACGCNSDIPTEEYVRVLRSLWLLLFAARTGLYFANLSTLKNKIISRTAKIQVYKTLIRPVATYGAETWTLTVTEENALRMFERKIVRRIYGPVMENNVWRTRYNEELNTLLKEEDIVCMYKG
jgi:hypothetical protein